MRLLVDGDVMCFRRCGGSGAVFRHLSARTVQFGGRFAEVAVADRRRGRDIIQIVRFYCPLYKKKTTTNNNKNLYKQLKIVQYLLLQKKTTIGNYKVVFFNTFVIICNNTRYFNYFVCTTVVLHSTLSSTCIV